ncbi:hypothetical protein QDW19_gp31 [Microbacterium phage AvGardian]|uniref:hypothetical protein n=1 Tax=Microbacterium phage AvGardian TaxID=2725619 RepID=UPI0014628864|nr:hypothetical protein QDW19_gp31 [Microbacterium phage AvGardian]QJD49846.1 hypothetical protein SEA_AVGARDIAN_31 [Microbacterium phage AvGardian]
MGLNKNGVLSVADKALAVETGRQVEAAMRRVLWEDRQIRAGAHRELDPAELNA